MPLRASAPATEEKRPRPVRCRHDDPGRLERDRRQAGLAHLLHELAVGRHDAVRAGRSRSHPGAPGRCARRARRRGRPSRRPRRRDRWPGCPPRSARRAGAGSADCRRPGRPGRWWWGRRGRAAWRCRAAGGGGARGRPARRRRPGGNPMRVAMRSTTSMPTAVWSPGKALADVVQERADEEEVRPIDAVGQLGGERGGLQEVTVDGEGVVGVALRLVAHRRPLRNEAHQQAVLVERLDLVDGRSSRDRAGRRATARVSSVQGSPGGGMRSARRWSEPLAIGRSSSAAVAARRSGSDGVVGDRRERCQRDLAVDLAPCRGRGRRRPAGVRVSVRAAAEAPPGRRGRVPEPAPAPDVVADPGDLPARRGDGQHERVRVGEARARPPPGPGPGGGACRARAGPGGGARP